MKLHPSLTPEVIENAAMALHEDMEASMTVHTRRNDRWEDLTTAAQQAIRRRAAIAINAVIEGIVEVERQRQRDTERERDEARSIVRDIYWMALRYADGRMTYAVSMCNAAVRKGYEAGWLPVPDDPPTPKFAKDGMFGDDT